MDSYILGNLAIHSIVFSPVVADENGIHQRSTKDAFLCAVCLFSIDKPSLCINAVIAETVSERHGCITTQ